MRKAGNVRVLRMLWMEAMNRPFVLLVSVWGSGALTERRVLYHTLTLCFPETRIKAARNANLDHIAALLPLPRRVVSCRLPPSLWIFFGRR